MKTKFITYVLLTAPIFYQLDYRQRVQAEFSIPGLAGFVVKKSFETRYRPDSAKEAKLVLKGLKNDPVRILPLNANAR